MDSEENSIRVERVEVWAGPDNRGYDRFSTMKAGHIKDFDTTFIHNREYIETKGDRDDVYCDKVLIFVTKTKSNQNFATSRFIGPQHR